MARDVITIRGLGENVCWMIAQQVMGIPDVRMHSDYMEDKVGLLLFTRPSLPERMCVTAAIRQMGGTTIYQGEQGGVWRQEVSEYRAHLLPIFGYYMDCMYLYGFPIENFNCGIVDFPIINAGSPEAHPAHCLADIACMLKAVPTLEGVDAAWIGCANGTLYSLMEATDWFPFNLRVAQPERDRAATAEIMASHMGKRVSLASSAKEAVRGARFIFAGFQGELEGEELRNWTITEKLLAHAAPDARLLLSASPIRALPIDPKILDGRAPMFKRQSEYRLGVHKRLLHWVFSA